MVYGEYGGKTDSYLMKRREKLLDILEKTLMEHGQEDRLYELMEVERELTLRENM